MIAVLALFACLNPYQGTDSDSDLPATPVPQLIGPDGGEITLGDALIRVPAGALTEAVEIVIRDTGESPPAPYQGLSTIWSFEPDGLVFAMPIEVTLPYTPSDAPAQLFWSNADGGWDRVPATAVDGRITASVEHFSTGFAAMPVAQVIEFTSFFPPADVVVVVDDSCSMGALQVQLADQMGALVPPLVGSGLDLHLGVITTDVDTTAAAAGRLRSAGGERFITAATPDPELIFAQMVAAGTAGFYEEKGRAAVYNLLELRADIPANVDFYRDDATLSIVFLSDEQDQSGATPISRPDFGAWLAALKPRVGDVLAHAIVFPPGQACPQGLDPGADYVQYATWTGGEVVNICDSDWTPGLLAMADRLNDSARVTLPEAPSGDPEVAIETAGASRTLDPTEYTWAPAAFTVYFDQGTRPAIDDLIRVTYQVP